MIAHPSAGIGNHGGAFVLERGQRISRERVLMVFVKSTLIKNLTFLPKKTKKRL